MDDCYELISEVLSNTGFHGNNNPLKRKLCQVSDSPGGVMDAFFSSDSSSDSWEVASSCISSSPHEPLFKKRRVQEQQMRLPTLSRVFVDAVGSPH